VVLERLAWQRFQVETVVGVVQLGRPTRCARPVSSFGFEGPEGRLVIAATPIRALREAGSVVALLSALVGVALFLVQAGIVDAVAPAVPAYDDAPWLALNPPEVPLAAFEDATGLTQEAVISQFGPPMRVRRDTALPDGCIQCYVYATRGLGERRTTGLCFNGQGRVASFVGQTVIFDLPSMSDDPRDFFAATGLMSLILAVPLAAMLAVHRRLWRLKLPSVSLKESSP
jgi:hypothetical protein